MTIWLVFQNPVIYFQLYTTCSASYNAMSRKVSCQNISISIKMERDSQHGQLNVCNTLCKTNNMSYDILS